MKKQRKSRLAVKLTISVILFSILLCIVICYMGYQEFTSVLELQYNDTAYEIAETAKSYLNADKLDEYLETGVTDAEYDRILHDLDQLVITTNATFIYVAKVDPSDYMTLTYIYDSINPALGFDRYELGYTAKDIDGKYVNNVKKVMTTGERVTEYCYSYSEESGAHTTAGTAVYNSKGEIIAFLGVEKAMTSLEKARETYVLHIMEVTALAAVIFLILYTLYLNREMIRPILTITREANRFAGDNVKNTEALSGITSSDEIGILAQAISKMEIDVEKYIENITSVTAEKERIGAELNVATKIQADMLPCIFPPFPNKEEFDIFATNLPAKEVGGDFYDFFLIDDDHLGIVMADVSGKGVPAALFMVISKTLLKNQMQNKLEVEKVFELVNNQLCENNTASMFVTVFAGVYEISTGIFTYVNAGHNPPALYRKGGEFTWLPTRPGFVLAGMEDIRYKPQQVTLQSGDRLFMYTDGVTEAMNPQDELFSDPRLLDTLNQLDLENRTLDGQLKDIKAEIDRFADGADQADDITMLMMEIK